MTQLYKTPFLPHLYCRLAFGQASWSPRGRKRFVSSINLSGWCSRAHSIRLLAVPLFAVFLAKDLVLCKDMTARAIANPECPVSLRHAAGRETVR